MMGSVLLVSHVEEIALGVERLISEVAKDIEVITAAGLEAGGIGTSFEKIYKAVEETESDQIYAFFDLGSAKMNLELVQEMTDKELFIYDVAFVEGAYNAAALLQAGVDRQTIENQLEKLKLKK